jgi:hypothetical protein
VSWAPTRLRSNGAFGGDATVAVPHQLRGDGKVDVSAKLYVNEVPHEIGKWRAPATRSGTCALARIH